MSHRVLSWKQLPTRLPITSTIAWYLFLDHLHAPTWVWGVMGTLGAFLWLGSLQLIYAQEQTEIRELNVPWLRRTSLSDRGDG